MTPAGDLNIVTGAFSYSGKYITQRLLAMGKRVKTLTGHPSRPTPFGDQVSGVPYHFDSPTELVMNLRGATTLYNTYWVRFPYRGMTFEKAIENTRTLIRAAEEAGIHRIVQISITHASKDSLLPYFRGKGLVEEAVRCSRLSHAILRPSVIFGHEDILINNIAWFLRRFPAFAVFGPGAYQVQPVYVGDVADLAVRAGDQEENLTIDAGGPETYTFKSLVRLIAEKVHSRAKVIHLPPGLAFLLIKLLGYLVEDVVLTWEEVQGLMAGLVVSEAVPAGQTRLSEWLEQHADTIGVAYASELRRHYR
jgi:NADH dehydrogenase